MGKSAHNNGPAPGAGLRPSLLAASTGAAEHNILDAMGQGAPGAPAPARAKRRVLWLLPALAIGVGVLWAVQRPAPPSHAPVVRAPAPAPTPAQTVDTRPATAAQDPAVNRPGTAPAPTPFEALNDNGTHQDPAPPANPLQALELATAGAAPSPQSPAPAAPPKASKAKATTAAAPAAKASKPASTSQAAQKSAASQKPASKPATQVARSTTQPKPQGRDPDAELIGAIMKHLGTGATAVAAPPSARSAQTIAELVQSCQSKDAIEALLCQRRICDGSWGKAQACPMSQAPQQASVPAKR